MTCLFVKSSVEGKLCQENSALEMSWIARHQADGYPSTGHFIWFQCQGKIGQIRMWRKFPGVGDARLRTFFVSRCPQPAGVGESCRGEFGILLPGLPREAEGSRAIWLGVGGGDIVGRSSCVRANQ